MLTVAAFTRGKHVPSARFRVRQYRDILRSHGVELTEHVARLGGYPPTTRWVRPAWAVGTIAQQFPSVFASHRADVTLLQRSLVSTLVTLEAMTGRPRVLDVDDAIWAHRRGGFAEKVARMCDSVICGNSYLAERFGRWNRQIEVIATGVDTDRFLPVQQPQPDRPFTIGWSGSSGGLRYLSGVEAALARVLAELPDARLLVSSNHPPVLPQLDPARVEYLPWSPQNEVATFQRMDVGLMPLEDSVWARGKCSYKMLLYMACGKPVVVSPVGMNGEVLQQGEVGFGASTEDEWVEALLLLGRDRTLAQRQGSTGRTVVETHYALPVTGGQLARHLLGAGA